MQSLAYAACGTGFTCLMTVLGAAFVFLFRHAIGARMERACLGFAGGVMAAAAVFSLLLPAMEQMEKNGIATVWGTTAGFLAGAGVMLALDVVMARWQLGKDDAARRRARLIGAVTLHNIPEGMAVGLAFAAAVSGDAGVLSAAAALAFGVGMQNLPEGAAISLPLRQSGMSRWSSFLWGAASGVVEMAAGAAAVLAAAYAAPVTPGLMAFSAGAMLFVVADDMLPEAAKDWAGMTLAAIGYALMLALDVGLS